MKDAEKYAVPREIGKFYEAIDAEGAAVLSGTEWWQRLKADRCSSSGGWIFGWPADPRNLDRVDHRHRVSEREEGFEAMAWRASGGLARGRSGFILWSRLLPPPARAPAARAGV